MTKVIGICGGSGAGKTTLINALKTKLDHLNPCVLSMDNYYKAIEKQAKDENGATNFDLPSALDEDKLTHDLNLLLKGEEVHLKEYSFNTQEDENQFVLCAEEIIIVEGLFTLHYPGVKAKLDYSIYVDLDKEEQLKRRIKRDTQSRGYSEEMIRYQWTNHVLPCYAQFLQPYKNEVDFVFHNDDRSEADFQKLMRELQLELNF